MPFVFGAQLYDLGEPFGKSDGNKRVLNTTVCPDCEHPDVRPALNAEGKQELQCCWQYVLPSCHQLHFAAAASSDRRSQ